MSAPILDLTDPANPCTLPAFLGYKLDTKRGVLIWRVCMDCESRHTVAAEAARLGIEVSHGLCSTHFQDRLNQLTGDHS